MPDVITVRRAAAADAPAITDLCEQLGYPATIDDVLIRLDIILSSPIQAALVAQSGGRVIGWVHVVRVIFLESAPFGEIGGLVVDSRSRNLGAGRALMRAAEDWARGMGLSSIRLRSGSQRHEAHQFYRAIGYLETKTQITFSKNL
jgi:GNAT superfamily N-acetyltransferase